MIEMLLLVALNAYISSVYARIDVEPDFATFAMWGVTGARYGKDFVDCKTPLVHSWLALLGKLCKQRIVYMRLIHFLVTGAPATIYYALTKDFAGALAFLVMVHSGWLLAFHGNVGDLPAGMIFLALIVPGPWIKMGLLVLATLYDPKLIAATGLMTLFSITKLWLPAVVYSGVVLIALAFVWKYKHSLWELLVESSFTIPARMQKSRKGLYTWMPTYTGIGFIYLLPWVGAAVLSKPEILYWIPPLAFLLFQFTGRVVRQNHLIPLVAWVAASGIRPEFVYALAATDFISSGLYLPDIWKRFYTGLADLIKDAKAVGLWLADKPGTLWVNTMHTEIYLWAKKPPVHGMMEVIEVHAVAKERRRIMENKISKSPPDWIVVGNDINANFDYSDYAVVARSPYFVIYKRRVQ